MKGIAGFNCQMFESLDPADKVAIVCLLGLSLTLASLMAALFFL